MNLAVIQIARDKYVRRVRLADRCEARATIHPRAVQAATLGHCTRLAKARPQWAVRRYPRPWVGHRPRPARLGPQPAGVFREIALTNDKDGGSAFPPMPIYIGDDAIIVAGPGMSLRDWFAGQVIAQIVSMYAADTKAGIGVEHLPRNCAAHAYRVADALIAEGRK